MNIVLDMHHIIALLNGKAVTQGGVFISVLPEDTSISKSGAVERIKAEWDLALEMADDPAATLSEKKDGLG